MNLWTKRAAGVAVAATAALAVAASPATAANDSPKSPRATPERVTFCDNPNWWYPGFRMTGTTNDGSYGTWVITRVVDDPHQTTIYATFAGAVGTWWNCR